MFAAATAGAAAPRVEKACHVTGLLALYFILRRGALVESHVKVRGDNFLEGFPGVYCFSDVRAGKAETYCPFTDLVMCGSFLCVKFELLVDRTQKALSSKSGRTD